MDRAEEEGVLMGWVREATEMEAEAEVSGRENLETQRPVAEEVQEAKAEPALRVSLAPGRGLLLLSRMVEDAMMVQALEVAEVVMAGVEADMVGLAGRERVAVGREEEGLLRMGWEMPVMRMAMAAVEVGSLMENVHLPEESEVQEAVCLMLRGLENVAWAPETGRPVEESVMEKDAEAFHVVWEVHAEAEAAAGEGEAVPREGRWMVIEEEEGGAKEYPEREAALREKVEEEAAVSRIFWVVMEQVPAAVVVQEARAPPMEKAPWILTPLRGLFSPSFAVKVVVAVQVGRVERALEAVMEMLMVLISGGATKSETSGRKRSLLGDPWGSEILLEEAEERMV